MLSSLLDKLAVWDEPARIEPAVEPLTFAEATKEKKKKKKKRAYQLSDVDAYSLGEQIGISWEAVPFTVEALQKGFEVELEHGDLLGEDTDVTQGDPEMTAKIAWAHLKEDPRYYDKLETIEEEHTAATMPGLDEPYRPPTDPGPTPGREMSRGEIEKGLEKDLLNRRKEREDAADPVMGLSEIIRDELQIIESFGEKVPDEDIPEILEMVEIMLFDVEDPSEGYIRDIVDEMVYDYYEEKNPLDREGGPSTVEERPGVYSYAEKNRATIEAIIRKRKARNGDDPCDSVGDRKKSDGKGRGLGRGKGKGPRGVPVDCPNLEKGLQLMRGK